ncbi:MAG: vlmJ [Blastococcus sp.]|nr:vlmJ [Blastococcus sp.]
MTELGAPQTLLRGSDCLVVANPAAAAVSADLVRAVEDRLARHVRTVRTAWTRGPGHAGELAAAADAGVLVPVGGDGTVAELVQGMRADQVLCPLPAGSGNSTARNLFGDRTWQQVLDLLDGRGALLAVRQLDLMRLEEPGVVAVLGASSGFLAQVLVGARSVDPALTGIDRYYAAAVDVLAAMPDHPTRVTVDGVVLHDGPASSVAVGGGRFRARSFQFLPESVLDDGLLDVNVIAALDHATVAELLPLIPEGTHLGRPDVRYARGRRVVVERTDGRPLVAEFDGSVWDAAGPRLTAEVLPGALRTLAVLDPTD